MISPNIDMIRLFLHVLAATVWVGGQLVLGSLVPALRKRGLDMAPRIAAQAYARIAWPAFGVLVLTGVLGLLGACEGDGAGPATTAAPAPGVTPTPSPESPFCAAMAAIVERIENDPPSDVTGYVADAYRDLLPVAPDEIVPALEALIADLDGAAEQAATIPTTAVDDSVVDDVAPTAIIVSPGEQLADYVDETCNRVGANPGPAATQPP